jgi:hypothetical protein
MKRLALLVFLLAAGCTPSADMDLKTESTGRVEVTRIGVFKDSTAYNSTRAIYLIVDTETGKEFIGVSGVGISETGSHVVSKNQSVSDER